MTESRELTAARERYAAALHHERTRRAAQDRLTRLRHDAEQARSRLSRAQTALRMEHDEAEEWAGRGFAQLALWIIGRLEDRRDLEAHQAVEAATRVADATAEVGALDATIAETAAAECASQIREVDEAKSALTRCNAALDAARDSLVSAHSWGTYDTWFGGGTLASMAKRNHVEKALGAIDLASGALRDLRHELADVRRRVEVPTELNVPSSAWTFDVWFDNIFSDANMQHRIEATDESVGRLRTELNSVRRTLDDHRAVLVAHASRLRTDASALLTGRL